MPEISLLALACAPDTLPGQALGELGVDLDVLWGMIERAREHALRARVEAARADEQATQQIRELRRAKQQAIEAQEFERAAGLRDQERTIMEQGSARTDLQPEVLLQEISRRLGIPETHNPPSSESS